MNELTHEEMLNMSYKDITYLILNEGKPLNTLDLFKKIIEMQELPKSVLDKKIGEYYTSLTTDKRFIMIDGKWDLKSNHTSDKFLNKVTDEEDEEADSFDEENIEDDMYNDDELDETSSFDSNENVEDDFDDEEDLSEFVVVEEDDLGLENN